MLVTKSAKSVTNIGYIDVGDGCWRRNVLVITFIVCDGFVHFGHQHHDVTNITVANNICTLSSFVSNMCHQHRVIFRVKPFEIFAVSELCLLIRRGFLLDSLKGFESNRLTGVILAIFNSVKEICSSMFELQQLNSFNSG